MNKLVHQRTFTEPPHCMPRHIINQVGNNGRIPKCLDAAVWIFLSSSSEQKITYTCRPIQWLFFHLVTGHPANNVGSLSIGRPHSSNVNHCVFIYFLTQRSLGTSHQRVFNNIRWIANRPTDTQTDWHKGKQMNTKKKSKKTNTACCQCSSPRYRVFVLSSWCRGCHPKGLIVASL